MVHLAAMADGGLARLRVPGGALDAAMLRAVADAAERLGSGEIDLTNRANLQIRGIAADAGPALVGMLDGAGFRFHGEADRRRNVLLDPFAGVDPEEQRDLRPLGRALDVALIEAPWIGNLSPKFSFALDGGGRSRIAATPSDVTAVASDERIAVCVGDRAVATAIDDGQALGVLIAVAEAAAEEGVEARAKQLSDAHVARIARDVSVSLPLEGRVRAGVTAAPPPNSDARRPYGEPRRRNPHPRPLPSRGRGDGVAPRFGVVETCSSGRVALSLPAPVGRLDPRMLRFLADVAEQHGDGVVRLAPWSGVVLAGVAEEIAAGLIDAAVDVGFTPPTVAERLRVIACAGAPSCERAREPAKGLGAATLALAAAEPDRLPETRATLHLSACAKGCAGSAATDLLMLGTSEAFGWSLHRGGSPRRPGAAEGRLAAPRPADLLALLRPRG